MVLYDMLVELNSLKIDFMTHPKQIKSNAETTVIVGMSGGVDSSVSALLLKQQGYKVIGLFMKNWDEIDEDGRCSASEDYDDVARVCEQIGIPYYAINFVNEYREHVFAEFLEEYKAGHTPNPDILCNREIKFKRFLQKAIDLGADFLATGHYCQSSFDGNQFHLERGTDANKDQSYFLYAISQEALAKTIFPIGHLPKSEVRNLAAAAGLATAKKKDSVGICFIGKKRFPEFIERYLEGIKGPIITVDGEIVGEHQGLAKYTLGQRKGMGIGGAGDAWFVVGKDTKKNQLLVAQGEDHSALYSSGLTADTLTWIAGPPVELPFRCTAKIRYRQEDQPCTIVSIEAGIATVVFDQPQRAITPRQSAVFYSGNRAIGGGMIIRAL
jgi:tRNA-specific 2-thiouridylase